MLTLTPDTEEELQETMAGLRASAADFAAGRWTTPEELDAALRARGKEGSVVPKLRPDFQMQKR